MELLMISLIALVFANGHLAPRSHVATGRTSLNAYKAADGFPHFTSVVEVPMSVDIPESKVQAAISELDKVRGDWLARPNVNAVDVGLKFKDGQLTDELAIRVHVKRKLPREELQAHELFPTQLGGFSVDVIEANYVPQAQKTDAFEPVDVPQGGGASAAIQTDCGWPTPKADIVELDDGPQAVE
jgi:hypothetical protein